MSGVAGVLVVAVLTPSAAGQTQLRRWSVADGLPQGSVYDIAQTPDRAVWVATFGGVARFDGAAFMRFDLGSTPALPSNRIVALDVDEEGAIWGGAEDGAFFRLEWTAGEAACTAWSLPVKTTIWSITTHQGAAYLATDLGLWTFDPTRDPAPARIAGALDASVISTARDVVGDCVWAGGDDGMVYEVRGRNVIAHPLAADEPIQVSRTDGVVLALTRTTIFVRTDDAFAPLMLPSRQLGEPRFAAALPEDEFVIVYDAGVRRIRGRLTDPESLTDDVEVFEDVLGELRSGFVDGHGQVWLGSLRAGLARLARRLVRPIPLPGPGRNEPSNSIIVAPDDALWTGSAGYLATVNPGGVSTAWETAGNLAALHVRSDGAVLAAIEDTVWLARSTGLEPILVTRTVINDMLEHDGAIWIAGEDGLTRRIGERVETIELPDPPVTELAAGLNGAVWAASPEAVHRIDGEDVRTVRWGAAVGQVRTIQAQPDGDAWVGTYGGGLFVIDDAGPPRRFTTADGLPENIVTELLIDAQRERVWMLGNRGVYAFALDAFRAWTNGEGPAPRYRWYDPDDGMAEGNFGNPAGALRSDGRPVFSTIDGPHVIEPSDTPRSIGPPQVLRVLINGHPTPIRDHRIDVPVGPRRVTIEFGAVNLVHAQSTHYACRVRPGDDDWQDLGAARRITLTRSDPGPFVFELRASFGNEPWVTAAHPLNVVWRAAWWETDWFRAVAVVFVLAIAAGVFWRLRHRQRVRIESMRDVIRTREAAFEREHRLIAEVNHRVRNNLASVLSLMDVDRPDSAAGIARHFHTTRERIHTMAQAHSMLSRRQWSDIGVRELLNSVLSVDLEPHQFEIHGDDLRIHASRCQSLALAVHELAANAREHGALQDPDGRIVIEVEATAPDAVRIAWAERHGPPTQPPHALGTGLRLVNGFLVHDLGGRFVTDFDRHGFRCEMTFAPAPAPSGLHDRGPTP